MMSSNNETIPKELKVTFFHNQNKLTEKSFQTLVKFKYKPQDDQNIQINLDIKLGHQLLSVKKMLYLN